MRHTISPLVVRAILPGLIKQMFAPAEVPERFSGLLPKALMLRPLQLRAAAEDAALMTPTVTELEQHYQELTVPVTIITGADDQFADVGRQSARLHQDLPGSEFISLPGLGHMIHHLDPDADTSVVERVAQEAGATPWTRAPWSRTHAAEGWTPARVAFRLTGSLCLSRASFQYHTTMNP